MPALRFKTCRLLQGNVWNRELTKIQRRILGRLRNKKRSIKINLSERENLNSYIKSQTTRKLPLFHGDLPITEMHRGTEQTSYIPLQLNPETRLDVILVRLHFRETISQARQPISHRRLCVNNGMVSMTHFKVSHGDLIRRFLYSFLFVAIMVLVMYMISMCMGSIDSFFVLLSKAGVSLGGRALSLALCKGLGCSGGLALAIGFAARALFASEAPAALLYFMNEDGAAASSSSRGEEMSNEQSMELHPYSPGLAPLLVPEEGENDLLRAVAPFLRGEVNHNIPVQDQRPQAGASPVDESISDSEEDESSSSSSYEVSVSESEDESVDDSIPQYWGRWEEREQDLFMRAQSLKIREEVEEEYFSDIRRNLNGALTLGEQAYQNQLAFEEFEVGMVEIRLEIKDHLFALFSIDPDPLVVNYRREHPGSTSRLEGNFRLFYEGEVKEPMGEIWDQTDPDSREMVRHHVDSYLHELKNDGLNSIGYINFKILVLNKF